MGVVLVVGMAWLPASASEGTGAEVLAIGRSDASGGSEVVIIDGDGSGARTIFHHPGPATFETLAWSPDGRTLAVDLGVATDVVVGAVPPPDADRRHETHLVDVATGA